jgi:hypothetical protein
MHYCTRQTEVKAGPSDDINMIYSGFQIKCIHKGKKEHWITIKFQIHQEEISRNVCFLNEPQNWT